MTTPTRLDLLEAVAEAVAKWRIAYGKDDYREKGINARLDLAEAYDALRAHDAAQPAAGERVETVEVWGAVRADPKGIVDGRICPDEANARYHANRMSNTENGQTLGSIFRLRVPLATTPVIAADVENRR